MIIDMRTYINMMNPNLQMVVDEVESGGNDLSEKSPQEVAQILADRIGYPFSINQGHPMVVLERMDRYARINYL